MPFERSNSIVFLSLYKLNKFMCGCINTIPIKLINQQQLYPLTQTELQSPTP